MMKNKRLTEYQWIPSYLTHLQKIKTRWSKIFLRTCFQNQTSKFRIKSEILNHKNHHQGRTGISHNNLPLLVQFSVQNLVHYNVCVDLLYVCVAKIMTQNATCSFKPTNVLELVPIQPSSEGSLGPVVNLILVCQKGLFLFEKSSFFLEFTEVKTIRWH